MISRRLIALLISICCLPAAGLCEEENPGAMFDQKIAPLLVDRCLDCHSGDEPKGKLDLSTRQSMLQGGESGPVIVPSQVDESLLWQQVSSDAMPPDHPLDANEKELLRQWIASGAQWGHDPIDRFRYTTSRRAGMNWWSLQPVQRPPPPAVRDSQWPINAVDRFILNKLEAERLAPSAEATRRVLIRRLYFDLLGLPPTPEQVLAFEQDKAIDAYERLVDQMLASPRYGERWARHWLDIVRFGESDGFERNVARQNAWPYRDWVISSLNQDLPYDRFVKYQIAGDILAPNNPGAIRATGFLVAGLHNTVVANNDFAQRVARHEELEDLIGTMSQALLGLTVQCARCHDHKFDPIAQADYYRMVANLNGVQHGERSIEADSTKVYAVSPIEPQPTHVLVRGDVNLPAAEVTPASPRVLEKLIAFQLPANVSESLRRLAIAEWITYHDNPLFARVIVNRLWHYHFGRGIVETPSDFGFNGGRPSHPELLDWLASELVRSEFQLKSMHRLLVTSRTYRQAAKQNPEAMLRDADNRWLWRKSPQRLEGESLRDTMLLVSGQLNEQMGGPGFRDVREYFNSGTTYYEPIDVQGPEFFRRTIYRFAPRGERSPLLDTFDCPDPSVATPRRQVTTTPLQALALLNDSFTLQMSRHLAARVRSELSTDAVVEAQIERVFQWTLQRTPRAEELPSAVRLASQHGLEQLCRALMNSHEFVVVE